MEGRREKKREVFPHDTDTQMWRARLNMKTEIYEREGKKIKTEREKRVPYVTI